MLNPTAEVVVPEAPPRIFNPCTVVVPLAVMKKDETVDVEYVVGDAVAR